MNRPLIAALAALTVLTIGGGGFFAGYLTGKYVERADAAPSIDRAIAKRESKLEADNRKALAKERERMRMEEVDAADCANKQLRAELDDYAQSINDWITENGAPTGSDDGGVYGFMPKPERVARSETMFSECLMAVRGQLD